jgi:hypothetical protein
LRATGFELLGGLAQLFRAVLDDFLGRLQHDIL